MVQGIVQGDQRKVKFTAKRAGRKRAANTVRRMPPVAEIPVEVLRRRSEGAGIPIDAIESAYGAVARRVRHDGAMVSALGRMIWAFDAQGRRQRRLVVHGPQAGREPVISEGMELAALAYQRIWSDWRQACGMPVGTVQAHDHSAIKVDCSGNGLQGDTQELIEDGDQEAIKATGRLNYANGLLDACPASVLVRKVVEMVVLEDVFVPLLLERPAALEALRIGLRALEDGLIRGPRGGRRKNVLR
jgi:hypothetical protein